MNRQVNLGIMATGRIARKVAGTLVRIPDIKVVAVASRSLEKAQTFAEDFNIPRAYGSYEEMLSDDSVDMVYVATPHSEHAKNMKMCIEAGKAIICEKAFTLNEEEAKEVIELAKQKGIFVSEAIWCRFAPQAQVLKEIVRSGKLGRIHTVSANLGYNVWERERVHSRALGGGALLDVGIYCLNFIDLVLNGEQPVSYSVSADVDFEEKTDRHETVMMQYASKVTAVFTSSEINCTDRLGIIYGSEGYAVVENVNCFGRISIFDNSRSEKPIEVYEVPEMISGYEYEFIESAKAFAEGKRESGFAEHNQTLRLMHQMDEIRKIMGVIYPCEEEK